MKQVLDNTAVRRAGDGRGIELCKGRTTVPLRRGPGEGRTEKALCPENVADNERIRCET